MERDVDVEELDEPSRFAEGPEPVELRCFLKLGDRTLTETWLYRYIPFDYAPF